MSLAITQDRVVSLSYTLTIDGAEIERGNIDYLHGHQNIVPGLEEGLEGAEAGAKLSVEVPPGLGYGERMEMELQRVPRTAFPEDMDIQRGMQFGAHGPDGHAIPVWVADVESDVVVIDLNHPLAGATLVFDVEILSVREGTDEEKSHGHMHGPDGHGHGH